MSLRRAWWVRSSLRTAGVFALVVVVGEAPVMEARLVRRTAEDACSAQSLFETVIDPLVHAARPPGFTF